MKSASSSEKGPITFSNWEEKSKLVENLINVVQLLDIASDYLLINVKSRAEGSESVRFRIVAFYIADVKQHILNIKI